MRRVHAPSVMRRTFAGGRAGAVAAVFLLFALAACGSRGERWNQSLVTHGPVAIGDRLAWLDETLGLLVVLDPASEEVPGCVTTVAAPRGLAAAGGDALVTGMRGSEPVVQRIHPGSGNSAEIILPAAFDRIAVSPDGAHALALHDPAQAPRAGIPAARNLNEFAVVDLGAGESTRLVLQTGAVAPVGVRFTADGSLAAVLFDRAVAIVEMRKPYPVVTVPLKLPSGQPLRLQEAVLAADGSHLFLRTSGLDDVISIAIDRGAGSLSASVNFLGPEGGGTLLAIAVPVEPAGSVAALYAGRAVLLDADGDTTRERSVALAGTPNRIASLGDGLLLLHGDVGQSGSAYVAAWDPAAARLAQDRLAGPILAAPQVAAGVAFFATSAADAGGALTAVTAEREELRLRLRLRPVGLDGVPVATAIDPDDGTLFVGLDVVRKGSDAAPIPGDEDEGKTGALVSVGAADLSIHGFTLDRTIADLGLVGAYVYALHPFELGEITAAPKGDLRRGAAMQFDGVLLTGMMGCER
ncbi:MAG TPA: hypothetical protein VGD74_08400 [Vulgatibacter sp.]